MQTIERKHTNPRMSQIVIHGNTVYLAGQVGESRHNVADQTRDALARVDALLKEAGSTRQQLLQTTIWLADMADFEGGLRGDECRVGCLGTGRPCSGPRLRRSQAR
jgi:Putative translation initiation inhibitor, yjgF family